MQRIDRCPECGDSHLNLEVEFNEVHTREKVTCTNCGWSCAEESGSRIDTTNIHTDPQPKPTKSGYPAAWSLVISDMACRDIFGAKKYGTRLQPHNGRDALSDAYQEALDLAVYLRTALYERDGK